VSSIPTGFSLAIDPHGSNTLYAGTFKGIFKSTDAGTSWTATTSESSTVLGIDPQYPSTVYASGAGGLLKTTDGGANWSTLNSGLSTAVINSLAIDPQNSSSIYAMDWNLLHSTDAGSNWSRVANTGHVYPVKITVDPQNPGTIYSEGLEECD